MSLPHFKSLLKYRPKEVKGIISCSCGCKLHTMTGVNTIPGHTHSLTYFSFYRSHTLCSRLQSSVSYWPSVSLPIQLSVCACVPQCEGVTDPDGDGFIITRRSLLFLLLFYCCFYCSLRTTNTMQGCKGFAERARSIRLTFVKWHIQ